MPFTDYVIENGEVYCLDRETKKVTAYKPRTLKLRQCPESVLGKFVEMLEKGGEPPPEGE